ncbi:Appr-1-p processing protein [Chryseobacterium shigense]|uniref:O-acetyl-ADP-ribose deacetylase (Regulator of RNase III), contains Macro domain n=1 Tax=Chryseobacterium shigense TaxID=297244 RepID=A0A1N7IGN8_9FLAO|nr:macro domain-containing protein [Chryseobacterium shigense]PQA94738.1 Appr-1-p processing protein [Chryseobacterium shigense]SIS36274.1 O-acetyl-ADP-ribose deacetylase (regulator of RNase III), contains Macro domain [Chryseobacterium shigense]
MKEIQYLKGDATQPQTKGNKIITHICNDIGGWGRGFVMAISKRWKEPEANYREWYESRENFSLGEIQIIMVEEEIWVCNMIGQHKTITSSKGISPIRYEAVERCLEKLVPEALQLNAEIHMPRIGCGLAGGKWEEIEPIIEKILVRNNIPVWVYDFD